MQELVFKWYKWTLDFNYILKDAFGPKSFQVWREHKEMGISFSLSWYKWRYDIQGNRKENEAFHTENI